MYKIMSMASTLLVFSFTLTLVAEGMEETDNLSSYVQEDCVPKAFIVPLPYKQGSAAAEEVLEGKTFTNKEAVDIPGTMANNGAVTFEPGTASHNISEGYHNGSGRVKGDGNLTPGNIKSGTIIFGVAGTAIESSGTAIPVQVLSGQTFSNASGSATGTMPNVGQQNVTPTTVNQTINLGFHDGSGSVSGDTNLVPGNIKSGTAIFGVSGTSIESNGAATPDKVLFGETFSNASGPATGTMPNVGQQNVTPTTVNEMITQGFHDGTGMVTGDNDLTEANIKSGVDIFGVVGTLADLGTCADGQVPEWSDTTSDWECMDLTSLFWSRTGNAGTDDTIDFIGTSDNQDVVIKRNNNEVIRITGSTSTTRVGIIMGHSDNSIGTTNSGSVIAGGGTATGTDNVGAHYVTGYDPPSGDGPNVIDTGDIYSVIGGGQTNYINHDRGTISGGRLNRIHNIYSTIGGGDRNESFGDSVTISGGWENAADGDASTVGGGRENNAGYIDGSINGDYATVPGGRRNVAIGDYSFAAGLNARAEHDGTFVWNDHADGSSGATLSSTAENQFMVRARGGFVFYTAGGTSTGTQIPAGSGSWSTLSDRASKENFTAVNEQEVLARLANVPIQTWNYRTQPDEIRHIGPVAQDFAAAFSVGETDKMISTVDADGVALAAIQGLYQLREKDALAIATLQDEVMQLKSLIGVLLEKRARQL